MGLLDTTDEDTNAAITSGLLNFVQMAGKKRPFAGLLAGLHGYEQTQARAKELIRKRDIDERNMKIEEDFKRAQIQHFGAQDAQYKSAENEAAETGAILNRLLGGQAAPSQYGLAGGGISLDGVQEPMRQRAAGLAGASIDDIAALKARKNGPDLLEMWKAATGPGQEVKPGTYYLKDGQRSYLGDPTKGVGLGPDGSVQMMPNADVTLGRLAAATTAAQEGAKAPFTLIDEIRDGKPGKTLLSDFIARQSPRQPATAQPSARAAMDPMAMAQAEAISSGQPVNFNLGGRQGAFSPRGDQRGSFIQTGPSNAEKLRDEAGSTASKDFISGVQKRYDALQSSQSTLDNLDKAKQLIGKASPFMGPFGQTKLETIKFLNQNIGTNIAPDSVNSAEELRTRIFLQIMENLKKMDAQPSEYQQRVMQEALGNLGTDPRALGSVLDTFGDVVRAKVGQHNKEVTDAIGRGTQFPFDPRIQLREAGKSVVRTGTKYGRKWVRYSDGSEGYGD